MRASASSNSNLCTSDAVVIMDLPGWVPSGVLPGAAGGLLLLLASIFTDVHFDVSGWRRKLAYLVGAAIVGWLVYEFTGKPAYSAVLGMSWPYELRFLRTVGAALREGIVRGLADTPHTRAREP